MRSDCQLPKLGLFLGEDLNTYSAVIFENAIYITIFIHDCAIAPVTCLVKAPRGYEITVIIVLYDLDFLFGGCIVALYANDQIDISPAVTGGAVKVDRSVEGIGQGELEEEVSVGIEFLHGAVEVADEYIVARIDYQAMWCVELSRQQARRSPAIKKLAVSLKYTDPRVIYIDYE